MDTSQLETFLAIIEYKNYSKAAEFLNVTQPTVTARIKNLENELNCKLFDREGKNVTLSTEGKVFVEYATGILTYMKHSKEAATSSKFPSIKIGIAPGFSYSFVTKLIRSIISIDNLSITIIEGENSVRLNEQILSGELDLVFTRNAVSHNPNIISEFLFNDKIVLVCGKDHRLAEKDKLTLNDLEDETLIWFLRNTPLLLPVEKQLIGISNIKHIEVGNNEMLKEVVGSGLGIGVTLLLGVDEVDKEKIIIKDIEELDTIPNKVYIQSKKQLLADKPIKQIMYSIMNEGIMK
jgi:LysR family transcriptional regulator, regulator of the ytmI operon